MRDLEKKVQEEVENVADSETGFTFGQMKMITSVKEQKPSVVKVDFVPSSPFCPIALKLASDVKKAAEKVQGIKKCSGLLPQPQRGRRNQQNDQQTSPIKYASKANQNIEAGGFCPAN